MTSAISMSGLSITVSCLAGLTGRYGDSFSYRRSMNTSHCTAIGLRSRHTVYYSRSSAQTTAQNSRHAAAAED